MIPATIHAPKPVSASLVERFGPVMRRRRMTPLIRMMAECHRINGRADIIDIGGTSRFWKTAIGPVLDEFNAQVLVVNLPGVEKPRREGRMTFEDSDGCDLSRYGDASFDIAFSNSVIEHVGDWKRMRSFANEVRRVAKAYFVQTPNFWFPVEPHCVTPFFHWLPFASRVWLLRRFDLGYWRGRRSVDAAVATAESAKLLSAPMMQELFPEARIMKERFFFMPKSLIATCGSNQ
ncbi:MAG: hypothetical protein RLY69_824 [Verrucomicrobiota bacterium]|jgi:hypothetical protein